MSITFQDLKEGNHTLSQSKNLQTGMKAFKSTQVCKLNPVQRTTISKLQEDETPHSPGNPNLPFVHYPNQKFGFQLQETVVVMVQIV
jgi:hypothetical protein